MSEEVWSPIPETPYYQASTRGRIRSLPRWVRTRSGYALNPGVILKPRQGTTGRLQVQIYLLDGSNSTRSVHTLVCSAFYGPSPEGKPWVLHRDGNHLNNTPENLYWGTPTENAQDALRHGKNFEAGKTHCIYGHEYTEENTYVRPDGKGRQCRLCIARRAKEQSLKKRLPRTLQAMKEVNDE